MARNTIIGVSIEGLGDSNLSLSGYELRLSSDRVSLSTPNRYYVPQLASWIRRIRTECEPLEGLTTQGTIDLSISDLDAPDSIGARYGNLCLRYFWTSRLEPAILLTDAVTDVTTTWNVTVLAGNDDPVIGDILYINREAVRVTLVVGSPVTQIQVARAQLETEAEEHDSRDPFLYTRNPLPIDRAVTVYELDLDTDTEVERMRGVVENFQLTQELKTLSVSCRDLLGRIGDRVLGENRYEGRCYVSSTEGSNPGNDGRIYDLIDDGFIVDYKPLYADNDGSVGPGDFKVICVEIDGHPVLVRMAPASLDPVKESWGYAHQNLGGLSARNLDGRVIDADEKGKELKYREILHADADEPHCLFKDINGDASDHPADIMLCILTSTGSASWPYLGSHTVGYNGDHDWLPKPWGLGVDSGLINVPTFQALKKNYPTRGIRYRNFYLGHGDENPKALEVLFDLAQACNSYIYLDENGRISIKYFGDPGLAGVDASLDANDIMWVQGAAAGVESSPLTVESVYALRLEVCAQGPGGKPGQVIVASDLNESKFARFRWLAKEDKLSSTLVYGDPVTHGLSADEIARIGYLFASRFRYQQARLPVYDIQTVSGSPFLTAGMWVALSHPAFYNLDYERGVYKHRFHVLSADWDPKSDTQQVRIVDWSAASTFTKSLAPSFKIDTVTSDTVFAIHSDYFTDGNDEDSFVAGGAYTYSLWTADGIRRDDTPVAGVISGTDVTLAGAWTSGGIDVTPDVGDIIRISTWFAGNSWDDVSNYAYVGDADAILASGVEPSDWSI